MILIGRYLSPFARRVGVSLHWLELAFEHRSLSPSHDLEAITAINPMGKVPILMLDDGEILIESSAILDAVLETVPGQTLLPASGPARRRVLQNTAIMTSALDKAIIGLYERMNRPPEKVHQPYVDGVFDQARTGVDVVEGLIERGDFGGVAAPTLADLTAAVGYSFMNFTLPDVVNAQRHPRLAAMAQDFENTEAFQACQIRG